MDVLELAKAFLLDAHDKGILPQFLGETLGKQGVVVVLIGEDVTLRSAVEMDLSKEDKNARLYAAVVQLLEDNMKALMKKVLSESEQKALEPATDPN